MGQELQHGARHDAGKSCRNTRPGSHGGEAGEALGPRAEGLQRRRGRVASHGVYHCRAVAKQVLANLGDTPENRKAIEPEPRPKAGHPALERSDRRGLETVVGVSSWPHSWQDGGSGSSGSGARHCRRRLLVGAGGGAGRRPRSARPTIRGSGSRASSAGSARSSRRSRGRPRKQALRSSQAGRARRRVDQHSTARWSGPDDYRPGHDIGKPIASLVREGAQAGFSRPAQAVISDDAARCTRRVRGRAADQRRAVAPALRGARCPAQAFGGRRCGGANCVFAMSRQPRSSTESPLARARAALPAAEGRHRQRTPGDRARCRAPSHHRSRRGRRARPSHLRHVQHVSLSRRGLGCRRLEQAGMLAVRTQEPARRRRAPTP